MKSSMFYWGGWLLVLPMLACSLAKQTPQPAATITQLAFEVQMATPTLAPIFDAPTYTPNPNATPTFTPTITPTLEITPTNTLQPDETPTPEPPAAPAPTAPPPPSPAVPLAEPLQGGVWDFEDGFTPWGNPYGDACPGSGLANGWTAFTSRDQYGSACMNQTVWKDNVHSGHSAQEITFAYVGIEAGVFRTAPSIPGHRYTIEAHMRREFSPATVTVFLGVDLTGGADWQSENVQWFPWNEDVDDAWGKTSVTVTATGGNMTIFLKGSHPYPEPGGTLRLDNISVVDIGPE
ncbi:MAG: hypothetical protein JW953_10040 [Anaerolineae bacterium]|nr:hypothetical protein [Anaerolineae bacterium]